MLDPSIPHIFRVELHEDHFQKSDQYIHSRPCLPKKNRTNCIVNSTPSQPYKQPSGVTNHKKGQNPCHKNRGQVSRHKTVDLGQPNCQISSNQPSQNQHLRSALLPHPQRSIPLSQFSAPGVTPLGPHSPLLHFTELRDLLTFTWGSLLCTYNPGGLHGSPQIPPLATLALILSTPEAGKPTPEPCLAISLLHPHSPYPAWF